MGTSGLIFALLRRLLLYMKAPLISCGSLKEWPSREDVPVFTCTHAPTLVKMAGIQSHMFLSEPFSEEKFEPPVKKPTIPWWWWVGRVRVRVNHLFFLLRPFEKLV